MHVDGVIKNFDLRVALTLLRTMRSKQNELGKYQELNMQFSQN